MDFGLLFFGVLFPSLSLAGAFLLQKAWRLGSASENWPSTKGRITESRFEPDDESYNLIVKYEYTVDGVKIQGDTFSYRGFSTDLSSVEQIVARYPIDSNVSVYFDPTSVETCVLEPGIDRNVYLAALIVLCVLFVVGVCCLCYVIWSFTVAG